MHLTIPQMKIELLQLRRFILFHVLHELFFFDIHRIWKKITFYFISGQLKAHKCR